MRKIILLLVLVTLIFCVKVGGQETHEIETTLYYGDDLQKICLWTENKKGITEYHRKDTIWKSNIVDVCDYEIIRELDENNWKVIQKENKYLIDGTNDYMSYPLEEKIIPKEQADFHSLEELLILILENN